MPSYSSVFFIVLGLLVVRLTSFTVAGRGVVADVQESPEDAEKPRVEEQTPEDRIRSALAKYPGHTLHKFTGNGNNREDIEALRQVFQSSPTVDWSVLKAKPINEPDCFIEVQVPQRVAGRCIKLGGQVSACQSPDFLSIDRFCGSEPHK